MSKVCIFDLEVENHEHFGKLAFPKHPLNYIVAAGWAHDNAPVQHVYYNNKEEAKAFSFNDVLGDCTELVAHNATFELHWMLHTSYDELMAWLKRGGQIYCTQYAQYLLSMQQDTYPTLDAVAVAYGGTTKIDAVKLLWDSGSLTSEIDKDLLIEYLTGAGGDIENTRIAYKGTYKLLKERGMLPMFRERMRSLLFGAIATWYGLHVDCEVAFNNLSKNNERIDELTDALVSLIPDDAPAEVKQQFNTGSRFHLSALLYGGAQKYEKQVPYDPPKYIKEDYYKFEDGCSIKASDVAGLDATAQLQAMDLHGGVLRYKAGKNKGLPKIFREDTDVAKLKKEEFVYVHKGLVQFTDLTDDIANEFTGKRAQYRGAQELSCGTPVYSTKDEAVELLARFVPEVKPIAELAALNKDVGTYYLKHKYNADGSIKSTSGALSKLDGQDIINHRLNNCATVTGRLSSADPNFQNLPRGDEGKAHQSMVKEHFTSRFTDGRIVEVDYTALEVVTGAAITNDKALLDNLLAGTDMHLLRLSGKLKRSYDELKAIYKDKTHPEHSYIKQERTYIKPPSFAAQYGASARGISFATGVSVEFAEWFLANEAELFPNFIGYRDTVRSMVEAIGLESPMRRELYDDGSYGLYRQGYFEAKGGTRYAFRQHSQWKDGQQVLDYKDTEIANYWCQGEASFIVQVSCGLVINWLIANDFFGGKVLPINTVHDAIYLDCINEEWASYAGKAVAQLMAATPKYMCEVMPKYREWRYDVTPFPAAAEMGKNMMNKTEIK